MKRFTRKNRGFTLIEVTLAIVVGIILVAGATLIYNQARQSAGNSRANAKVVALQSVVEEFAAMNGGLYPDKIVYVQGMWERRRPDDFNKSPWGGQVGPFFNDPNVKGVCTFDDSNAVSKTGNAAGDAGHSKFDASTDGATASLTPNQDYTGGLFYEYSGSNTLPFASDLRTNQKVVTRAMAVYIADQQGRYPNFVVGGRSQ